MPSKDTYGATPSSNASATGAADATATLLDGRSPSTAGESSSRFWRAIGICVGALALIVATFFGTIELMNYEYQRTTFEVYTGCMTPATKARLARAGFAGPCTPPTSSRGGAPVKMAPAGEHRPGVFVSTWMPDNEWAFAVAPAHAPERRLCCSAKPGTPRRRRWRSRVTRGARLSRRALAPSRAL